MNNEMMTQKTPTRMLDPITIEEQPIRASIWDSKQTKKIWVEKRRPSKEDIEKVDDALRLNKNIDEGKIPEENLEAATQAVKEVLQEQCVEEEEEVSVVKETQPERIDKEKDDHSPMVVKWSTNVSRRGSTFKFHNHLEMDSEFLDIVKQHWSLEGEGCAMYRVMRNLEKVKTGLIDLNMRKYRDIDRKETQAREKLDVVQEMLQNDPLNTHLQRIEKEAREEHYEVYQATVVFLRQKSKQDWLCEGDLNTQFFHQAIRTRRYRNRILTIQDSNGRVHTKQEHIVEAFEVFYKTLLSDGCRPWCMTEGEINQGKTLSPEQQLRLLKLFEPEEVRRRHVATCSSSASGARSFCN
ncbi:hypothetical protein RIF29_33552 [Crotalaria pallida]|uniref:Uncharacterized protein n=1 Tax=Crotalaria pallida TaxID=3830 RepID=A0AAN9E7X4_CROPI